MKKIFLLLAILLSFSVVADEQGEREISGEQQAATADEEKFLKDSDECYKEAEKKLEEDSANKDLGDEKKSEVLDDIFNSCMKARGNEMEEEIPNEGDDATPQVVE